MRKEQEESIDPGQPCLIVVYGATKRKRRPLRGDVVVIGRSPGCDIGLVSAEVAPVHCVLVRMADGWRVRDCSGRATRINGRAIHDEVLKDGDVVQVGAFSFEARLPAVPATKEPDAAPGEVKHLERSRRHFAELALRLRGRVRDQKKAEAELAQRESDLEQMEHRLRYLHREVQVKPVEAAPGDESARITSSQLETRAEELEHYAQHLRRQEKRLREREANQDRQFEAERADFEADLTRLRVELEKDRRELMELRLVVQQRQADLEDMAVQFEEVLVHEREQLERCREQITREREYLDLQRQEIGHQRIELERLHGETTAQLAPNEPATRDTWVDTNPDDRLESARKLLREIADRRKISEAAGKAEARKSESMQEETPKA
jgi:pSer/pThr/pTyr-binding forkhead associated (FHA) protein